MRLLKCAASTVVAIWAGMDTIEEGKEGEMKGEEVGKKFRRRETKHLSTDADSSTNTTVGWSKNT